MTDWQPIETAPKDFTNILIWVDFIDIEPSEETGGNGYQIEGGYLVAHWAETRWETVIAYIPGEYVIIPSHWMPLPDPPA